MKSELRDSFIAVPVPTALYVHLTEVLGAQTTRRDPAGVVVEAIGEWLQSNAAAPAPRPRPRYGRAALAQAAARWSDDWIMFGEPRRG
jgi:hypothetical protein